MLPGGIFLSEPVWFLYPFRVYKQELEFHKGATLAGVEPAIPLKGFCKHLGEMAQQNEYALSIGPQGLWPEHAFCMISVKSCNSQLPASTPVRRPPLAPD